jgi:hypothetical protein
MGDENGLSRISESKNIPKNYSKAIINFIKRNETFRRRVLRHLGVDEKSFMESLEKLGGQLSSIAQLQWLWGDSDNPFGKVYRVLSMEYLRKHSLAYIFNSRVNIHSKHLKYRYKMAESVGNP